MNPPICTICHSTNRPGVKYCSRCGNPLDSRECPHCFQSNRVQARRCRYCGKALLLTGRLPPNSLLAGRYRIEGNIAKSGMGAIYRVSDQRLPGKAWALKEMSESAFTTGELPRAMQMFKQEMQIHAACHHPNLPQISDFFEHEGKFFIVMEFVDGTTLDAILKSQPVSLMPEYVLSWGDQLCGVLSYLHSQNPPIIHRDIKPLNIMLDHTTGLIKLIDFGIARFQRRSQHTGDSGLQKGYGTAGYAPPEQFGSGPIDARADIYALGITLYQLLTRYDPVNATDPFNMPSMRQLEPNMPESIVRVIERATRRRVDERYNSAQEMRWELQAARFTLHAGWVTPPGFPPGAPDGSQSRK